MHKNPPRSRHKYATNQYEMVGSNNVKPCKTRIAAVPISKRVYVHYPVLPRSARIDTKATIVVTNRDRVQFEKLRRYGQYDYKMKIDAAGMLPPTWKYAGLPPDGMFAPKLPHDHLHQYSDYDGLAILAMAACNLIMRKAALSNNGQKPAEAKVGLKPAKSMFYGNGLDDFQPPIATVDQWDELDEKCMVYVLGILVRLFYRGDRETGDRDRREQELRKAIIMYMSGTGGASQFANFTSLCMSLELAASFAKSVGIGPDDSIHKDTTRLLGYTIRGSDSMPAKPRSGLAKVCCKILGYEVVRRVEEYPKLNNRLKHYGSDADAEYFNSNVDNIREIMRRLRVDAAYVILLGLMKSYGTEGVPARADKNRRASSVILGMVGDCVDRHSADNLDCGVEEKIRRLRKMVENDTVKSNRRTYNDARSALGAFEMLIRAAGMLGAPDGADSIRTLVREYEDVLPSRLKPSESGLVRKYDEKMPHDWLVDVAYVVVVWMDRKFHAVYEMLHVKNYGWTSPFGYDSNVF